MISNKSTVEKKPSYLSLSSAEKTSFSDLSEYSIACNTKLISYFEDAVILHVLKVVNASAFDYYLILDQEDLFLLSVPPSEENGF